MKIGSKVVCIIDIPQSFKNEYPSVKFPVLNKVYTIRDFIMSYDSEMKCRLAEIVNGTIPNDRQYHNQEVAFPLWGFREIDTELSHHTTETLIEELEEQLQPC